MTINQFQTDPNKIKILETDENREIYQNNLQSYFDMDEGFLFKNEKVTHWKRTKDLKETFYNHPQTVKVYFPA